jgi:hypothetical protein
MIDGFFMSEPECSGSLTAAAASAWDSWIAAIALSVVTRVFLRVCVFGFIAGQTLGRELGLCYGV